MNIKDCEVAIKQGDPAVLASAGILTPAAKKGYICPECGSGTGRHGTGTRDFVTAKGYTVQKCFNCGGSFNNLELIARAYGLDIDAGGQFYCEAVKIGCQLFGLELDNVEYNAEEFHRPRPKIQVVNKSYAPEETVADSVKDAVEDYIIAHATDDICSLFKFKVPLQHFLFDNTAHLECRGKTWECLQDCQKLDLVKGSKYPTKFILAKYLNLPAGGDIPAEFNLYKKICEIFNLPFKTKAQEKAERDAKIAEFVHADIEKAVANIDNSPVDVRRGLPVDILQELHFGWMSDWRHPNLRVDGKGYPSRRLLATTPHHYEAMTPKADRDNTNPAYWKMHTSPREPFFLDVIPFGDVNLVFEGAVDAASAYFALNRNIPCYATGGAAQYQIFVDVLNKICADGVKPHFVIFFDSDETGRRNAPEFQKLLRDNGYPCAIRFLSDSETKTDANDILVNEGKDALADKINSCLVGVDAEFSIPAQFEAEFSESPAQIGKPNNKKNPNEFESRESLLTQLEKLHKMPQTPQRDAQIVSIINNLLEWRYTRNKCRVSVKATAENLKLIFENDPVLRGLFGYDEFQATDVLLKAPIWRKDKNCIHSLWTDRDDAQMRVYLKRTYKDIPTNDGVVDNFIWYSEERSFHPVKQWLEGLPSWDRVPRIEKFFVDYLSCDDNEYTREVTKNFFIGALSRLYNPGCNFQTCLILAGAQGVGKSYILEQLGNQWHVSLIDAVDDSHAVDAIQRGWIVEIAEFAALKRAEVQSTKRFISDSFDTRRFVYAKRATKVPRHCVFAATTNDHKILKDETGNRRFLILESHSPMNQWAKTLTPEIVQQVWAEAMILYRDIFKDGFDESRLQLPNHIKQMAERIATNYKQDDGMDSEIKAFLDTPVPAEPVWNLLTKKERRKFIEDKSVTLIFGELEARWKTEHKRPSKADTDDFNAAMDVVNSTKKIVKRFGLDEEVVVIRGIRMRDHISPVEVYNECFDNDKRKSTLRISEILQKLQGWELNPDFRIRTDKAYKDLRTIFCRVEIDEEETTDTPDDDISPNFIPFHNNDDDRDDEDENEYNPDDYGDCDVDDGDRDDE